MPWFWLVWALSAAPPSNEAELSVRPPRSTRTETTDEDIRRVAFDDETRRPKTAADLRDPFAPAPPSSTAPIRSERVSVVDLKDPFEQRDLQPAPHRDEADHPAKSDLRDPFEAGPAPPAESAPPDSHRCPTATTPEGVPIQRPRALRTERPCSDSGPPLRDPFPPPQRPSQQRR